LLPFREHAWTYVEDGMAESIFEKYGGLKMVSQVVHDFYQDVLASNRLKPFFDGINMERLMDHQVKLFSHVLGGPVSYDLSRLRRAHQNLDIDEDAFNEVTTIMREALRDAGMEEEDVTIAMDVIASTYEDIVNT